MKYVSIDLETTGLDPRLDQVVEIGMVLEDTENIRPLDQLPSFQVLVWSPRIIGQPQAIKMNWDLLEAATRRGADPDAAWGLVEEALQDWGFSPNNKATAAGKNVAGFDLQFFPEYLRKYFSHRCIDPGSVFIDWEQGPPSLGKILNREPSHRALEDARDVIEVLRKTYAPGFNPNQREMF